MKRSKAYIVTLNGRVYRDFLVYADSIKQATQIMRGDRQRAIAMDDHFEERSFSRPKRFPEEDLQEGESL